MNHNELFTLYEYTKGCVYNFYNEYKYENPSNNNFEDWNARDILGHLAWWVRFAGTKLEYIKSDKIHSTVTNLLEFNKNTFDSYKNISIHIVYKELVIAFEYIIEQMQLYSEEELQSTKFPIGFTFELWKYIELHVFAHPFMHIIPYYLKNKKYEMFIEIIHEKQKDLLEYNNMGMEFFVFKEYIKDAGVLKNVLEGLHAFSNKNNIVNEIIKINTI